MFSTLTLIIHINKLEKTQELESITYKFETNADKSVFKTRNKPCNQTIDIKTLLESSFQISVYRSTFQSVILTEFSDLMVTEANSIDKI